MLQTASYTDTGGRAVNEDSTRQARRGEDRLCLVVAARAPADSDNNTAAAWVDIPA